jgi:hypothetical protein
VTDNEFQMSTKRRLEILERNIDTIYECFDVMAKGINELDAKIKKPSISDFCPECHLPKPSSAWEGYSNLCTCPPEPAPQFTVDVMLGEMGSNGSWVKVYYYHDDKNWICHMQGYVGKNEDFFGSSHSLKEAVRLCYTNWKEGTK